MVAQNNSMKASFFKSVLLLRVYCNSLYSWQSFLIWKWLLFLLFPNKECSTVSLLHVWKLLLFLYCLLLQIWNALKFFKTLKWLFSQNNLFYLVHMTHHEAHLPQSPGMLHQVVARWLSPDQLQCWRCSVWMEYPGLQEGEGVCAQVLQLYLPHLHLWPPSHLCRGLRPHSEGNQPPGRQCESHVY